MYFVARKPVVGVEWKKVERSSFNYLYFNRSGQLEMKTDDELVPMEFLDSLGFDYYSRDRKAANQEL